MKFDEFLRSAAKDYKSSTNANSDAIWNAIAPEVAKAIGAKKSRSFASLRMTPWIPIGVGIAATLMIGIGVGRWSTRATPVAPEHVVAAQNDSAAARIAHVRSTAIEHLADAEVFLTTVRSDIKAGRTDAERAERSRELLSRTRLLLGSSNSTSPEVHRLLEDLELLLAEISAMQQQRSPIDQKLLDESMRDGNIIPRIRATLPAAQAGT